MTLDPPQVTVEREGGTPLSAVEAVFVDSIVALERARAFGVNPDARVLSTAPGLLTATPDAVQADAHMTPEAIWALDDAFVVLQDACLGQFDSPDHDLLAARYATLEFQAAAGKAAVLSEADFSRPLVVVELSSRDPDLDRMIRSPLGRLVADNPNLWVLSVPIESLPREDDPRAPSPSFRQRLAFSGVETIAYRLIERFSTRFRLAGLRGRALVLRENELCKETAWGLIREGFLPVTAPIPAIADASADASASEPDQALRAKVETLVDRHLGPHMRAGTAVGALARVFSEDLHRRFIRYETGETRWREQLDGLLRPGRTAVLTNWLNQPEALSLKRVLDEARVPMIFFQHGVTNEINSRMRRYTAQYGTSLCDLELAFNDRAARISSGDHAFRRGRALATGFPADYYRAVRSKRHGAAAASGEPPIWYVCTAFYVANHGQLEGVNDSDKCRHERAIVTEVLDRCRHRVVFKPYPGRRFEDPDPVEVAAEQSTNIEIHRTRLDLRYVVNRARVLVTARSFSTPSWCLATGLPMIHIDIPDQDPLDKDARASFAEGVFLFDASSPDFHESLRAFLDQPLEEIERLWEEKAPARQRLMREFMSSHEGAAGRRGARAVIDEIRRKAG